MRSSVARILARWATAAALLVVIVLVYTRWLRVNPTTVALTLLLLIQWLAASWGLGLAVALSVAAALCFNYYFLPPVGAFTIADTQNWIALGAFLATALIGSNLANRLHAARSASERRGRELELLYDFGQRLLAPETTAELLRALPLSIAATFGCTQAAVYLIEGEQLHASSLSLDLPAELLHAASRASHPYPGPLPGSTLVPLAVGVRPIGVIYLLYPSPGNSPGDSLGNPASPDPRSAPTQQTLEAMSSLVALSLERAAAVENLVHAEAASESDRLRATLLDAVTHDLRTPLTSIKAAVTALLSQSTLRADQRHDLLSVIDEESDRLDRLIAQAVEMAELDARSVHLDRRAFPLPPLLEEALESAHARWPDRLVRLQAPERLDGLDRPDRPDRPDGLDRIDGLNRLDGLNRPERLDRPDRLERLDRPDRLERLDRPDRPDRVDKIDRLDGFYKVDRKGPLPLAFADRALVAKVLLLLVENAAKYSTPGTPILVAAQAQGRWLQVSVSDQGPGIAPAEQEHIFDKFYRSPEQRYRTPGTGMGLPIARAIVEAHGGTLQVESSRATGSTFRFTLPRAPRP